MRIALSIIGCLFLAASAQADQVRLKIIGPDKNGLAGAKVRFFEWTGNGTGLKLEEPVDLSSDANGQVAFESKNSLAPPATPNPNAIPSRVVARVSAPQMATVTRQMKAGDNKMTLQEGQHFSGTVFDNTQQPVVGAKVVLRSSDPAGPAINMGLPQAMEQQSTTDDKGQWSFDGLPKQGKAFVQVIDKRFATEVLEVPLDSAAAPPLFLERGATIKGRLLKPDGQPAPDIALFPGSNGSAYSRSDNFRTGPDGRFTFDGLRAGDYYLQTLNSSDAKPLPYIIAPKTVKGLQPGDVRDIGDWTTTAGIVIKGKIVESGTKKPLEAWINLWGGPSYSQGQTDKNGIFSFRGSEDSTTGSISASGYINLQQPLSAAVNGVLDLGTIELKKGLEAQGTIKDKKGKPANNLQIYAETARGSRQYSETEGAGEFTFSGLEPGVYTLKVNDAKLVGEVKFTVAVGQKTPLITAVVDLVSAPATPKSIQGRALDNTGKPVAGARITLLISDPNRSTQTINAMSGIDGSFTGQFYLANATPRVASATRPGLIFVRADDFKVIDTAWRADVVFQPRGTALKGRIVDGNDQPVAGAYVTVAGRTDLPVTTSDAGGAFSLPDVPLEGIALVASTGRSYGQSTIVKAGTTPQITLKQTAPYDSTQLADELLSSSRLGYFWADQWDPTWKALGTPRMENVVMRANNGAREWEWEPVITQYLQELAKRDPKVLLTRGDELVPLAPRYTIKSAALLATLRARSGDPTDRAKAQEWLKAQSNPALGFSGSSVTTLLYIATVAEALEPGGSKKWVGFAQLISAQLTDAVRAQGATEWGQLAVGISPQTFETLSRPWTGNGKFNALRGAVQAYCDAGDLAAAGAMFKRMEAALPEAKAAKDIVAPADTDVEKPGDVLNETRNIYALALSKTDPAAAFALAQNVDEDTLPTLLIEIGKNAGRLGQTDLAAKALRQVFESNSPSPEPAVKAAQAALDFDPKLADELFALALAKSKPRANDNSDGYYQPSIAAYAAARAKNWPGESRILIEAEWAKRMKTYKPPVAGNWDDKVQPLIGLAAAMAKVDGRRALEMMESLPDNTYVRMPLRGQIAMGLLLG